MTRYTTAALAASIALALGTTAAYAATPTPPAATTLPGNGVATVGTATGGLDPLSTPANPILDVTLTKGANVITWGGQTGTPTINAGSANNKVVSGFNIGANATVNFAGAGPGSAGAVLNIDANGKNPSQIFGALTGDANVTGIFVANTNGILVGPHASIVANAGSAEIGLIGNKVDANAVTTSDLTGATWAATGGDVVVQKGATINAGGSGTVLIAGGGNVNVDMGKITAANTVLQAGFASSASPLAPGSAGPKATSAGITVTGSNATSPGLFVQSAGDVVTNGDLTLSSTGVPVDNAIGPTSVVGTNVVYGTLQNQGSLTVPSDFSLMGSYTPKGAGAKAVNFASVNDLVNAGGATLNLPTGLGAAASAPGVNGLGNNAGGTIIAGSDVYVGDFSNAGTYGPGSGAGATPHAISASGSFSNAGKLTASTIDVNGSGAFSNTGDLTASDAITVASGGFDNGGQLTAAGIVVNGGDLNNSGILTSTTATPGTNADVQVSSGSVTNTGSMTLGNGTLTTTSAPGAKSGSTFSINNGGVIASGLDEGGLTISANASGSTTSTNGSFVNTGALQVGPATVTTNHLVGAATTVPAYPSLTITANNGLNLGGAVAYTDSSTPDADTPLNSVTLTGNQVTVGATGVAANNISILAGSAPAAGYDVNDPSQYAVRVTTGTVITAAPSANGSAGTITIGGTPNAAGGHNSPNVILNGMLVAADGGTVSLGSANAPVADVFGGPSGMIHAGEINLDFSGRVKAAPYLNNANYHMNGLTLVNTNEAGSDGTIAPLALNLDPVAYQTNGQGTKTPSTVNVVVEGDVAVADAGSGSLATPIVPAKGTAVTGVYQVANTHLVVQSTGNITTVGSNGKKGDFYWPGLVNFGTIAADADGNPIPGTLSSDGTITLTGDLNNVLPGNVDGQDGVFFQSVNPVVIPAKASVVTNANAFVNFVTDDLTQAYADGTNAKGQFFGGAKTVGNVVTYGALAPANFNTNDNGVTVPASQSGSGSASAPSTGSSK